MSFEIIDNKEEVFDRKEKIEKEIADFRKSILEKFSENDQEKIFSALNFMLKIHLPQEDRVDGLPFASHPLMVAKKVLELHDNPELVIAALIHDSVEDQPDRVFIERTRRKKMIPESVYLEMSKEIRDKYREIFNAWSFEEIKDLFGLNVESYVRSMTNHDYNSLAESLNLEEDVKRDFINKMYAEHVEDIISDSDLFTLKLADLSTNIDLRSLDPSSYKHKKLKRKYKSVIENVLKKIKDLDSGHALYNNRERLVRDLNKVYLEQYN